MPTSCEGHNFCREFLYWKKSFYRHSYSTTFVSLVYFDLFMDTGNFNDKNNFGHLKNTTKKKVSVFSFPQILSHLYILNSPWWWREQPLTELDTEKLLYPLLLYSLTGNRWNCFSFLRIIFKVHSITFLPVLICQILVFTLCQNQTKSDPSLHHFNLLDIQEIIQLLCRVFFLIALESWHSKGGIEQAWHRCWGRGRDELLQEGEDGGCTETSL